MNPFYLIILLINDAYYYLPRQGIVFIAVVVMLIALFYVLHITHFKQQPEEEGDDDRLYNPLTGKFYDLNYSEASTSYTLSSNQDDNSNVLDDHQIELSKLMEQLINDGYQEVIKETEIIALKGALNQYSIYNVLQNVSHTELYYVKSPFSTVVITMGGENLNNLLLIEPSSKFKGVGFIRNQHTMDTIAEVFYPEEIKIPTIQNFNDEFYIKYSNEQEFKSNFNQELSLKIEKLERPILEFKNGFTAIYSDTIADVNSYQLYKDLVHFL